MITYIYRSFEVRVHVLVNTLSHNYYPWKHRRQKLSESFLWTPPGGAIITFACGFKFPGAPLSLGIDFQMKTTYSAQRRQCIMS